MQCGHCNAEISPGDRFCGECGKDLNTSILSDDSDGAAFSVILISAGDKKIQVIKAVCGLTGLGLKDAKELVETLPNRIKEKVSRQQGEAIKRKLELLGAIVEVGSHC
jgi:large subunit ribosomal protein L7/L12